MLRIRRTLTLAMGALLLMAPSAMADTIRYDVPPGPGYTVDNEQGIAKVTFNTCLIAGTPTTLSFTTVTQTTKDVTAEYKVLKEGASATTVFDPATVQLTAGDQSFNTTLTVTPDEATGKPILLRAKLDTANGEGVGEGPGIMVRIECVGTEANPGGPNEQGATPYTVTEGGGAAPVPVVAIPTPVAGVAAGPANCLGVRRVILRAGKASRIVVTVTDAGARVARATVKLRGLGFNITRVANAQGQVVFNVNPKRKGSFVLQSNTCIGADQLRVRAAVAGVNQSGNGADFTG